MINNLAQLWSFFSRFALHPPVVVVVWNFARWRMYENAQLIYLHQPPCSALIIIINIVYTYCFKLELLLHSTRVHIWIWFCFSSLCFRCRVSCESFFLLLLLLCFVSRAEFIKRWCRFLFFLFTLQIECEQVKTMEKFKALCSFFLLNLCA